jgi:hypothetical protein
MQKQPQPVGESHHISTPAALGEHCHQHGSPSKMQRPKALALP